MYIRILTAIRPLALIVAVGTAFLSIHTASAVELKWAAQNDILTLDPHAQNHATTNNMVSHAYEPLVRFDKNYKVEPALATSWQSTSPTTVRFNLRKNVKFQDGTPFTADDVLFSFDRILKFLSQRDIFLLQQLITKVFVFIQRQIMKLQLHCHCSDRFDKLLYKST